MGWEAQLADRLRALRPASICVLDDDAHRLATAALPGTPLVPFGTTPDRPCELALGVAALDGLAPDDARNLIHRIRLYVAPRLLLVARPACTLDVEAFRALGFELDAADPETNVRTQSFDLATYKPVPDWLNARYWAHPERWEP